MTDKELLELAAKAVGYLIEVPDDEDGIFVIREGTRAGHEWNPLTSDGDAFRLLASAPYLDTEWWVVEAWQNSDTEEGRRAYLRRRIVTSIARLSDVLG